MSFSQVELLQKEQNCSDMFSATVTVLEDFGLHARPAANLAKTAQSFASEIILSSGEQKADAKSILDILALAASRNTQLTLTCQGPDAQNAGETLAKLFATHFHANADTKQRGLP